MNREPTIKMCNVRLVNEDSGIRLIVNDKDVAKIDELSNSNQFRYTSFCSGMIAYDVKCQDKQE
jgi:hypothetical protein